MAARLGPLHLLVHAASRRLLGARFVRVRTVRVRSELRVNRATSSWVRMTQSARLRRLRHLLLEGAALTRRTGLSNA